MDRTIVNPAQIVRSADLLNTNVNAYIGVGRLAFDMLGGGTSVGGTACTPTTPASTSVVIGTGAIYTPLAVDTATYGSLPSNGEVILKQGILSATLTLACPPPISPGFSINYLIEGKFQEEDVDPAVVPYFNSANPTQPFQGPENNGLSQPTIRQDQFVIQVKAGAQAATGTQTTPAVDAGFVPLYVVTVAFGQAQITAASISVAPGAPFITATALDALTEAVANTLYLTPAVANTLYLPVYPVTTAEAAVGTPPNLIYPPGSPRRWGAVGNGINNDTAAVQNAINTSPSYSGYPGDIYGVTTVTFAQNNQVARFNGSRIRGISQSATSAAVVIQCNFCNFYDYWVELTGIPGQPTPNPNYVTASWWSNNAGTQFNNIFGCYHTNAVRGMVYGQLPGNAATSTIQSENKVYGWQTTSVSNPFFQNSVEGFIHFSNPIFFRDNSGWTGAPALAATARALENEVGDLFAQGGEIIFSSSVAGFGCDLAGCTLVGMEWEGAASAQIVGDGVQVIGGQYLNTQQNTSAFVVAAGVTGDLKISDMTLLRELGVGATAEQPMINASAANPSFTTILSNTRSEEWPWGLASHNVRLVTGGISVYKNHRLHITGTDPNIYNINTPVDSLIADSIFDRFGYTSGLTGWNLATSASGTTMTQDTSLAGPPGFNANSIHLHSTGGAIASSAGGAAVQVRPGETYWVSGWAQIAAGASGNTQVGVDLMGGTPSFIPIADATSIGSGVWTFVEGPVAVPPGNGNAFMAIGMQCTGTADMFVTDLRVRRAS